MKKVLILFASFILVFGLSACTDLDPINTDVSSLQDKIAELETTIDELQSELDAIVVPEFTFDKGTLNVTGSDLTEDLVLPVVDGVEIVWSSSDSSVLTSDGMVMRPSATRGDVDVVLTAVIIEGNLTSTKSFDFTVLAMPMTDKEKVDAALAAIPEIDDAVTEDIDLPTEVDGASIIWESSNEDVLTADGKVMRPHYDHADGTSVLTGYIVAGKELKIFKKTVTVEKMDYAVHGSVGNPFVVTLKSQEDHTIYVPVENVDRAYSYNEEFPYIYTPEFGETVPSTINGWGFAVVVNADGSVIAYYDGLNGKKVEADGTETAINAANFAKNQDACLTPGDFTTCPGISIPEDGYVFVFQNTGASTKNNRQFGYTYFRDLEDIVIEGLTTTPSTMQYEITSGVWWRGNATVWVPKTHINPDVTTFDYNSVVEVDENGMATATGPVIFTKSYGTTAGVSSTSNLDILNGWGIAAEITPETEAIQVIGEEGSEIEYAITTTWQITRVYDGIGGSIKTRTAPEVGESTPVGGGDYGKNVLLPEVGYVIVFPGTSYGYASDGDVFNRRIGADYFYHLENWVFEPILVEKTGLQAPVKGVFE